MPRRRAALSIPAWLKWGAETWPVISSFYNGESANTTIATARCCRMTMPRAAYAERVIRELKEAGGYDDDELIMIVKDDARRTIFSIPFKSDHGLSVA